MVEEPTTLSGTPTRRERARPSRRRIIARRLVALTFLVGLVAVVAGSAWAIMGGGGQEAAPPPAARTRSSPATNAAPEPTPTIARPTSYLQELVASDPFAEFGLPSDFKPVVVFLRSPTTFRGKLPIELPGSTILKVVANEVLAAYLPGSGESVMPRLEATFGKSITTRTFETVRKCARA